MEGRCASFVLSTLQSEQYSYRSLQDKKKEPAYGTDVLRLWAATVEYWRDMSIGPTVLAQTAESMRKIRNSARFMLGNIGVTKQKMDEDLSSLPSITRKDLGLVSDGSLSKI